MSAPALARELDVHYVLEGHVRRAGQDLRIRAHLVDATNDSELWSDKFAGTIDDVFDIQTRVAEAITNGLRVAFARESAGPTRPIVAGGSMVPTVGDFNEDGKLDVLTDRVYPGNGDGSLGPALSTPSSPSDGEPRAERSLSRRPAPDEGSRRS